MATRNEHERRRNRTSRITKGIVRRPGRIPLGFSNNGNNNVGLNQCYRNSVLQALLHAQPLVSWVRQVALTSNHIDAAHKGRRTCWICMFDRLARSIWGQPMMTERLAQEDQNAGNRPTSICDNPVHIERTNVENAQKAWRWAMINHIPVPRSGVRYALVANNAQEDARLYLEAVQGLMTDWAHTRTSWSMPDDQLVVDGLFQHQIARHWHCSVCGHDNTPTVPVEEYCLRLYSTPPGGQQLVTLIDEYFTDSASEHPCQGPCRTQKGGQAPDTIHIKDDRLTAAPRVLMIAVELGNFVLREDGTHYTQKNRTPTVYPQHLDLTQYAEDNLLLPHQSLKYKLSSVVAHQGGDMKGGHYVTWAEQYRGRFSRISDASVKRATLQHMLDPPEDFTPYILTYLAEDDPAPPKSPKLALRPNAGRKPGRRRKAPDQYFERRKPKKPSTARERRKKGEKTIPSSGSGVGKDTTGGQASTNEVPTTTTNTVKATYGLNKNTRAGVTKKKPLRRYLGMTAGRALNHLLDGITKRFRTMLEGDEEWPQDATVAEYMRLYEGRKSWSLLKGLEIPSCFAVAFMARYVADKWRR